MKSALETVGRGAVQRLTKLVTVTYSLYAVSGKKVAHSSVGFIFVIPISIDTFRDLQCVQNKSLPLWMLVMLQQKITLNNSTLFAAGATLFLTGFILSN